MEFKPTFDINYDLLRTQKLFLATPCFGGQMTGATASAYIDLASHLVANGLPFATRFLYNESLITRARNYNADAFIRSDATHLLFIDADVGFNPMDVIAMWQMMNDYPEMDVLCAPYPKKTIAWEKISAAVDQGFAEKDPNMLQNYVGDYVFNLPPESNGVIQLFEPTEVLESGTGFMMIRKETFIKWKEFYPDLWYNPDHIRDPEFNGDRPIWGYFMDPVDPETRRHLSEDYYFCQQTRKAGMKVYLCPWMKLTHTGSYTFGGSMVDLAQIGQPMTASPDITEKKPKKKPKFKR